MGMETNLETLDRAQRLPRSLTAFFEPGSGPDLFLVLIGGMSLGTAVHYAVKGQWGAFFVLLGLGSFAVCLAMMPDHPRDDSEDV